MAKTLAYVDKMGTEFYEGDFVSFEKTNCHMHVDGWGRDLPGPDPGGKTVYQCEGTVVFEKDRGEFVIIGEWPHRTSMYEAENLKHKGAK